MLPVRHHHIPTAYAHPLWRSTCGARSARSVGQTDTDAEVWPAKPLRSAITSPEICDSYGRQFMARGGRRRGAGRRGWRGKCESCLRLDVRQLNADGRLRGDSKFTWGWSRDGETLASVDVATDTSGLTMRYRAGEISVHQRITFARRPCRFGGERTFFACPDCHRRCAALYGVNDRRQFSCRDV